MAWIQKIIDIYNFIRPVLDVVLLAFILYKGYELLERTQALPLVKGAGFLALVYGMAFLLNLNTLLWVLNMIAPGLFIAVAIVFQPELRKIFMRLGQGEFFRQNTAVHVGKLDAVITACEILSERRRGMIIVFPRRINLKNIIETGTRINAELSSSLIVALFEFDGPLHDGAIIIQGGKITAAGCFLPLSERQDIRANFGTRHRASLGMAEQSDAVILIVSEETGAVSLAYDAKLYYDLSINEVTRKLMELLDKDTRKEAAIQTTIQETLDETTLNTSSLETASLDAASLDASTFNSVSLDTASLEALQPEKLAQESINKKESEV